MNAEAIAGQGCALALRYGKSRDPEAVKSAINGLCGGDVELTEKALSIAMGLMKTATKWQ